MRIGSFAGASDRLRRSSVTTFCGRPRTWWAGPGASLAVSPRQARSNSHSLGPCLLQATQNRCDRKMATRNDHEEWSTHHGRPEVRSSACDHDPQRRKQWLYTASACRSKSSPKAAPSWAAARTGSSSSDAMPSVSMPLYVRGCPRGSGTSGQTRSTMAKTRSSISAALRRNAAAPSPIGSATSSARLRPTRSATLRSAPILMR